MAAKKKTGRPSKYTSELAGDICTLLASGESLRSICKRPDMPNKSTVLRWMRENDDFCNQYARAREEQADLYADEIVEIADECKPDTAEVAKAKLRIDSRKWFASKVAPKKYGDKLTTELTGRGGNAIQIETLPLSSLFEHDNT